MPPDGGFREVEQVDRPRLVFGGHSNFSSHTVTFLITRRRVQQESASRPELGGRHQRSAPTVHAIAIAGRASPAVRPTRAQKVANSIRAPATNSYAPELRSSGARGE